MKGHIDCLGFYNSRRFDTFVINISTQPLKLTELEIFYKMQCFISQRT